MRLLHRITWQLSAVLLILFPIWGILFYSIVVEEINDETDDALEEYAERIIRSFLAGELLPEPWGVSNNSYRIEEISPSMAAQSASTRFFDKMVYIPAQKETEPARIYNTIFKDRSGRYYSIEVMIPTIEKRDLKLTIHYWIIFLYLFLLVTIIVVNTLVQQYSLRPLDEMLEWIRNLNLTKHTPPIRQDYKIQEFKILSEALRQSSLRNAQIYEQQSHFIGHASHELQTPIAIAKNRLEMLLDDPSLGEEQLAQILKTRNTLEDLSRLTKTLLLFTRIENDSFPDKEFVSVNTLLLSLITDFEEAYGYFQVSCQVEAHAEVSLWINPSLASVLFRNLLKNAYVHNRKEGQIKILIARNRVRLSNTSEQGALDAQSIFQRFYRTVPKSGSTGLGLPLVQLICQNNGMDISYSYSNEMHHFDLTFLPESIQVSKRSLRALSSRRKKDYI